MSTPTHTEQYAIVPYHDRYRQQILQVWEHSVLATHHFLSRTDFEAIKKLVHTINFNNFTVFCLLEGETVIGFTGVHEHKLEMLFLHPQYFGRQLGLKLLQFSVRELSVTGLDVNEQNTMAVQFYQAAGFEVVDRTETDGQGKSYPLLVMQLREPAL